MTALATLTLLLDAGVPVVESPRVRPLEVWLMPEGSTSTGYLGEPVLITGSLLYLRARLNLDAEVREIVRRALADCGARNLDHLGRPIDAACVRPSGHTGMHDDLFTPPWGHSNATAFTNRLDADRTRLGASAVGGQAKARALEVRSCRECGCTDGRACPGGCWWVEVDLCSTCGGAAAFERLAAADPLVTRLRGLSS